MLLLRFNIEDMRRAGMECLIGTDEDGQTATISIRVSGPPIRLIQTDVLRDVATDCGYNPDEIEAFIDEHEKLMYDKLLVRAVFNAATRSARAHESEKEEKRVDLENYRQKRNKATDVLQAKKRDKVKVYTKKQFKDAGGPDNVMGG